MTEAKHLLDQIVRGLDGVPDGPWEVDGEKQTDLSPPHEEFALFNADGHRMCGTENHDYRFGLIHSEGPDEDGFFSDWNEPSRKLMEHIARCSPDAIREIAAYVRDLERERDEARSTSVGDWANQRENDHLTIKFYEMKARATDAEARVRDLEERLAKAAEAMEPFNTDWATEDGWTDYACQNDRVVDWFGPSDFRRAAAVFSQIRSEK